MRLYQAKHGEEERAATRPARPHSSKPYGRKRGRQRRTEKKRKANAGYSCNSTTRVACRKSDTVKARTARKQPGKGSREPRHRGLICASAKGPSGPGGEAQGVRRCALWPFGPSAGPVSAWLCGRFEPRGRARARRPPSSHGLPPLGFALETEKTPKAPNWPENLLQ